MSERMSDQQLDQDFHSLEPVYSDDGGTDPSPWTRRLVIFLRAMAALSMLKGLYHWSQVCGLFAAPGNGFEVQSIAWQTATIFFAVIDLIAAVGLWLAASWGAVIWLTSVASLIAVDVFFPQVFGGGLILNLGAAALLALYLWLAIESAREHPV
jgi:hypothetical protein